ncbi:hypothetical protein [Chondromyces crocatus]|uniref:Uncharacterized protein n=1 Tax=Chondromyces crocatus TaxID=52 RepID=A0A0K1EBY6_CHOCO|nr:hypothetical protein [Chondromyces crocatus]AKT38369.1 uncharacterized protein CMC5_025150 [Chondromyces crocatus]
MAVQARVAIPGVPPVKAPLRFADDEAFLADLPYDPSVLFFDELLEVDPEQSLIRCRMPTDRVMPFVEAQRAHPVRHPQHVAGAVMVHATGMLGFVHAYYLLGLRHRDGWIGYGTHIHRVVFRKLVTPGTPIEATCVAVRGRIGTQRHLIRYTFEMRHEGAVCYEGEQTAVWMRVDESSPPLGESELQGALG